MSNRRPMSRTLSYHGACPRNLGGRALENSLEGETGLVDRVALSRRSICLALSKRPRSNPPATSIRLTRVARSKTACPEFDMARRRSIYRRRGTPRGALRHRRAKFWQDRRAGVTSRASVRTEPLSRILSRSASVSLDRAAVEKIAFLARVKVPEDQLDDFGRTERHCPMGRAAVGKNMDGVDP